VLRSLVLRSIFTELINAPIEMPDFLDALCGLGRLRIEMSIKMPDSLVILIV